MRYGCLIALLILIGSQPGSAYPRLVITGNRFEFGSTPQQSTVTQYFWFHSVGKDTVKIAKIETGCDCTTMAVDRTVLPPGDSMKVGVVWATGASIGNTGKYPRIHIEEQQAPERIYLTADVTRFPDSLRPVSIKPYRAEFSRMAGRSVDSVKVMLTNHGEFPVALKVVSMPMDEFAISLPDSLQPNETAAVSLWVRPEFLDKEFQKSVTLNYDGGVTAAFGNITIPVRRRILQ